MSGPSFLEFTRALGFTLTPGQEALARVCFDREQPSSLPSHLREVASQIFGGITEVPRAAQDVIVVVAGARSGKSLLGSLRLAHLALTADLSGLAPGERAFALVVAVDVPTAEQSVRFAVGALANDPRTARLVTSTSSSQFVIRRTDGREVSVTALAASEAGRGLRGRTLVAALLDESAFFRDAAYAVSDVDLHNAIAPRIQKGGQLIFTTTPWGETGLVHSLWQSDFGAPKSALVAHAPTDLMRDDAHTLSMIERERLRDPVNYAREFGAVFGSTEENLLDSADVDSAVGGYEEYSRNKNMKYTAAIDLATRNDFSVFLAGHKEHRARDNAPPVDHLVIDCARHWAPSFLGKALGKRKISVETLEVDLAELANHYRVKLFADSWGFDFVEKAMKARGVVIEEAPMSPSEQAKRASLMSALFRQGRITIPNNSEMIKQLKGIRILRGSGGQLKFAAKNRKGCHDDYAKALMILVANSVRLPVSGGDVQRFLNASGEWTWQRRLPTGNWQPCEPPIGTHDWLALADKAQREGFRTENLELWLAVPANLEALDAWRLKQQAFRGFGQRIFSR